jgi:hypothetical protein
VADEFGEGFLAQFTLDAAAMGALVPKASRHFDARVAQRDPIGGRTFIGLRRKACGRFLLKRLRGAFQKSRRVD